MSKCLAACAAAFLLACQGDSVIAASDYDRSCTQDADCAWVYEGDVCGGSSCACPNAAVNASAEEQFKSDRAAKARTCPPHLRMPGARCVGCDPVLACSNGTCTLSERQ